MPDFLFLPFGTDNRYEKVFYADISCIISSGNYNTYCCVTGKPENGGKYLKFKNSLVLNTIKDSHLLQHPDFIRIHHSHIIHKNHVLLPHYDRHCHLALEITTGQLLSVSEPYKTIVEEIYMPFLF